MTDEIVNNQARNRYELHAGDGEMAIAAYEPRGDALAFVHTEVPPALQGRGIASTLIKAALADVRERGLKAIPLCPFVVRYLDRHPEERDVVA